MTEFINLLLGRWLVCFATLKWNLMIIYFLYALIPLLFGRNSCTDVDFSGMGMVGVILGFGWLNI